MNGANWPTVILGETQFGMIVVTTTALVPVAADGAVSYSIRNSDGEVATGTMSTSGLPTGVYQMTHAITEGGGFASGERYFLIASYAVSGAARKQIVSFLCA